LFLFLLSSSLHTSSSLLHLSLLAFLLSHTSCLTSFFFFFFVFFIFVSTTVEVAATTQQTPEKLNSMIEHFKKVQHEYAHSKPLLPEIEYPRFKWGGRYPVPFHTQVGILFQRAMKTTIRDVVLVRVRMMAHCMLGVVAGLVWLQIDDNQSGIQDRFSLIIFSLIFLMLLSIMPTVLTCK
jgi:hypothetical protein